MSSRAHALMPFCVLALAFPGCESPPPPARPPIATRPARVASRPASQPEAPPIASQPATQATQPARPLRISLPWARFHDAYDTEADATIRGGYSGENRFEMQTHNVRKLILELPEMRKIAPNRGPPWNIQIDQQGIEITGRRGSRLELTRGENGAWNVTGVPKDANP